MRINCGGQWLSLDTPVVMGILNVTPNSFSDGGRFFSRDAAVQRARTLVEEGAAIVDVGGESTRPGACVVNVDEELDRVVPVIEAISEALEVVVSVDTSKPRVMAAAVAAGAGMVNDVRALRASGALEMVASLGVPVCLMHMRGGPATMQDNPHYDDVVQQVIEFLRRRMEACTAAGISAGKLIVDPGFGFGKNLSHNWLLLRHLEQLAALKAPVLVGISRKSMVGQVLDVALDRRLAGSLSAAVIAATKGAKLIRAHDVGATLEAIKVVDAVQAAGQSKVNVL